MAGAELLMHSPACFSWFLLDVPLRGHRDASERLLAQQPSVQMKSRWPSVNINVLKGHI